MCFQIPNDAFFNFIIANINKDPKSLSLQTHGKDLDFNIPFAITQIECRQRGSRHKLKEFTAHRRTLFPSALSYEQASSESIAKFHATLLSAGAKAIDLTAGLGIDSITFAAKGCEVTAYEVDKLKAEVLKYNADLLKLNNLKIINADSIESIKNLNGKADIIFVDPARRSTTDRRLYNLHDCLPNILSNLDLILSHCDTLLVKASPLLDISQTLKDIKSTKIIRAVSVAGECKEILIEASENASLQSCEAIDLTYDGITNYIFSYSCADHGNMPVYASLQDLAAGHYLYEPGAAVMKLSPWGELCSRFPDLKKISSSSHLFVSPILYKSFPGRILELNSIIDKKSRKNLKGFPANVVTRNYPLKADELRKKLGVKEGTDKFIYGTRLINSPILLEATQIRI